MRIPFSVEQFFDIFTIYNRAIWPAQGLAYILGIVALGLSLREKKLSSRIVSGILASFWIWMGVFYHIVYFSRINSAALTFGFFYILQGLIFLYIGTFCGRLSFGFRYNPLSILGVCFILYAMAVYPLLGLGFGHSYPSAPMFGVAPCPTTIFTFGLLLWSTKSVPAYVLAIPFLWSVVGMSAAVSLRVPQDYGLAIAGVLGSAMILIQNRRAKTMAQQSAAS